MRLKEGEAYAQCAGSLYGNPWQEVRMAVVTDRLSRKERKTEILAKVYKDDGAKLKGEYRVPVETLQDTWENYLAHRDRA